MVSIWSGRKINEEARRSPALKAQSEGSPDGEIERAGGEEHVERARRQPLEFAFREYNRLRGRGPDEAERSPVKDTLLHFGFDSVVAPEVPLRCAGTFSEGEHYPRRIGRARHSHQNGRNLFDNLCCVTAANGLQDG